MSAHNHQTDDIPLPPGKSNRAKAEEAAAEQRKADELEPNVYSQTDIRAQPENSADREMIARDTVQSSKAFDITSERWNAFKAALIIALMK